MAGAIDTQNKRGSIWHRWDPHIHTPGTALNNQYAGTDPWESFLGAIEASDPPIRALGITDYFGIERYEQVVEQQRQGRLANVGLIFPNVELRLRGPRGTENGMYGITLWGRCASARRGSTAVVVGHRDPRRNCC